MIDRFTTVSTDAGETRRVRIRSSDESRTTRGSEGYMYTDRIGGAAMVDGGSIGLFLLYKPQTSFKFHMAIEDDWRLLGI